MVDRLLTKLPPGGPCAQPNDQQAPPLASPFDELGPSSEARRAAGILLEELGRGWVADGVPALTGTAAAHWRGDLLLVLSGLAYASNSLLGRSVLDRHAAAPPPPRSGPP